MQLTITIDDDQLRELLAGLLEDAAQGIRHPAIIRTDRIVGAVAKTDRITGGRIDTHHIP